MLLGQKLAAGERITFPDIRQGALFAALITVNRRKTFKKNLARRSAKFIFAGSDTDRQNLGTLRRHLRADKTLPDQTVEPVLIAGQIGFDGIWCTFDIRWTDRLVASWAPLRLR